MSQPPWAELSLLSITSSAELPRLRMFSLQSASFLLELRVLHIFCLWTQSWNFSSFDLFLSKLSCLFGDELLKLMIKCFRDSQLGWSRKFVEIFLSTFSPKVVVALAFKTGLDLPFNSAASLSCPSAGFLWQWLQYCCCLNSLPDTSTRILDWKL